ncbi:MAG: hypothetical protein PHO66_07215 [Eubacteriales bacterium]|nr:hypothetical protein [Eubacteriales bacterium]
MQQKKKTFYATRSEGYRLPRLHLRVRLLRRVVALFFWRYRVVAEEPLPAHPCVFVCNHAKAYGPLAMCTRFARRFRPWATWKVCFRHSFYDYAMRDFWPGKPRRSAWFYRLLARALTRFIPFVMNGVEAVPVYRDSRGIITLRKSLQTLAQQRDLVIFPETDRPFSPFVNDVDAGFADMGKLYRSAEKKNLSFYPVYVCAALKRILVGRPVTYDAALSADENRRRIAQGMRARIDALARTLPAHRPVRYRG